MAEFSPLPSRATRQELRDALRNWAAPARLRLRLALACGLAQAACAVLQAVGLSMLLAEIVQPDNRPLLWPALALLAGFLGRAALALPAERLGTAAGDAVRARLRQRFLALLEARGPAALEGRPAGQFATAFVDGIDRMHGYYARYLTQARLVMAVPPLLAVVAAMQNWLVALVLLACVPLVVLAMALVGLRAAERTRVSETAMTAMGGYFLDRLQGMATLQLLGQGEAEGARIRCHAEAFRRLTMGVLRIAFLSSAALDLISGIGIAAAAILTGLGMLGHLSLAGLDRLDLQQALLLLLLAPEFFQPFRALSAVYHDRLAAEGAGQLLLPLLESKLRPAAGRLPQPAGAAPTAVPATAPEVAPEVELQGVTLVQLGRAAPVLQHGSARIAAGSIVALVGDSGAGKSTLLHAIAGLHPVAAGSIRLDGHDIAAAPRAALWQRLALLTQRPYLFAGTVRDNLTLAAPTADAAAIAGATQAAGLDAVLAQLPQGLDTVLGERGGGLSGGQAQRLALARAVLKDARLLLLDEPTAGLDAAQEAEFIAALRSLRAGRTVIVASHSPALIAACDAVWRIGEARLAPRPETVP